jgi:hypothetical protein
MRISKPQLTRREGEPEAYDVSISPRGADEVLVPIGTVTRTGPDGFEFATVQLENGKPLRFEFEVSTFEELEKALAERFAVKKISELGDAEDSIHSDTMHGCAEAMFMTMNILASRTDSMAGYIQALACAVATVMAEDVKDQEAFLRMFMEQVRKTAERKKSAAEMEKKLKAAFSALMESVTSRSSTPKDTKH